MPTTIYMYRFILPTMNLNYFQCNLVFLVFSCRVLDKKIIFWLLFCTSFPNGCGMKLKKVQKKGEKSAFPLPASSCLSLLIGDNLLGWFSSFHITLQLTFHFPDSNINTVWHNIAFAIVPLISALPQITTVSAITVI